MLPFGPFLSSTVAFPVGGVDFDGTNDYLTRGAALTGQADSPDAWLSMWLRIDGSDGLLMNIWDYSDSGQNAMIYRNSANKFLCYFLDSTAAIGTFGYTSGAARTSSASWLHLAMNWQWRSTLVQQVYINGVSDFGTDDKNAGNLSCKFTYADSRIGALIGSSPGAGNFNGCMAEFIWAPGQTLDLSVAANMAKLRDASGRPVDPGATGNLPSGTAPLVYLSVRSGDAATAFATNRGTGGNFTITGSLDLSSTSPSD